MLLKMLIAFSFIFLIFSHGYAENIEDNKTYTVAIYETHQLVQQIDDTTFEGFEIDVWNEIARRLNIDFQYQRVDDFGEIFTQLDDGSSDFGLGGIPVRSDRTENIFYSETYLYGGVSALVNDGGSTVLSILRVFLSPLVLKFVAVYLLFIVFFGHVFWIVEKRHQEMVSDGYVKGVLEGIWLAFKKNWGLKSPLTRSLTIPLWFITLLFTSIITAQVVSDISFQGKGLMVNHNSDLSQQTVALVDNESAELILQRKEFKEVVKTKDLDESYKNLKQEKVDAIIGNAFSLKKYKQEAQEDGIMLVSLSKNIIEEFYAIGMSQQVDQNLRQEIDMTIMQLRDNGYIASLQEKWLDN